MTSQDPSASGQTQNNYSGTFNAGRDAYFGNEFRANVQNFYSIDEHLSISQDIVQALSFDDMRRRKDMIAVAAPHSFDWIWDTECGFSDWLQSDKGIFWITGKPGSGKSTLSKYLAESHKTLSLLNANGQYWKILQFFYDFRSGKETPNNWEGLLRTLLIQINEISPKALDGVQVSDIESSQLLDTFCRVVQKQELEYCAFVDGIDETKESLWDSMKNLFQLAERVKLKICVSSRYFAEVNDWLKDSPKVLLQDFNASTIRQYLNSANNQALFRGRRPCSDIILDNIVDCSSGVVLWASLALEMALAEFNMGSSEDSIIEQLHELPKEMQDIYETHLRNVPKQLQVEAALYLYLLQFKESEVRTIELFSLMKEASTRSTRLLLLPRNLSSEQFSIRVCAVLGGLATVTHHEPESPFECKYESIDLMHETLHYFLRTNKWPEARILEALDADSGYIEGRQMPLEYIFGPFVDSYFQRVLSELDTVRWKFSKEEIRRAYPIFLPPCDSLAFCTQTSVYPYPARKDRLVKRIKKKLGHMVTKYNDSQKAGFEDMPALAKYAQSSYPQVVYVGLTYPNKSYVMHIHEGELSLFAALKSHEETLDISIKPSIKSDPELLKFPALPSLIKDVKSSVDCAGILNALQRYYLYYQQNREFEAMSEMLVDPGFMAPGNECAVVLFSTPHKENWSLFWYGKSGSTEHISYLRTCELILLQDELHGGNAQWKWQYDNKSSQLSIRVKS